ncbi:hypothetical protein CHUAL_006638 [Chamberlinius hualienensis]
MFGRRTKLLLLCCITIILMASFNRFKDGITTKFRQTDAFTVIILTYGRSGSSLFGELLSSAPNSTYFFEPMGYFCFLRECKDDPIRSVDLIERLSNCDGNMLYDIIQRSLFPIIRVMNSQTDFHDSMYDTPSRLSAYCNSDRFRVMKTLHLRIIDVLNIIQNNRIANLRVVHLLRDPRARFNSLQGGNWPDSYRSITTICEEMESDIKHSRLLPQHIYTRIKYEDIVKDPYVQTEKLFKTLYNDNLSPETMKYIDEHLVTHSNQSGTQDNGHYYSTYRRVDQDRWRNELPLKIVKEIQKQCSTVFSELGYKII